MYLLCVIAAGILWGAMSIFVRGLNGYGFSSMQIMAVRSLIASVLLGVFIFFKDKSLLRIKIKDIWMFLCTGIVSLSFFSVCYFSSILESGAGIAVILLYTSPVFVLLISAVCFKEKINYLKIIALTLTVAGCVCVTGLTGDEAVSVKGLILGLFSGLGYGLYSIFGTVALKKYKSLTITFYTFLIAALFMIPVSHPLQVCSMLCPKSIALCAGVAVFCTLLPFLLYTFGLSGLEAGKAAIFATVEPLVGSLVGILVWGESINLLKLSGMVLIFTAIILCNIKNQNYN